MPKGDIQNLKADIEDGVVPIAHLLLAALSMAKMNGVAKGIVMFVWRRTYGWSQGTGRKHTDDRITLKEFAQAVNSERTYVSTQLKSLVKSNVLFEYQDPDNGRYKRYGMNPIVSEWSEKIIDFGFLNQSLEDKLYVHSDHRKVVQTHNGLAKAQPLVNTQRFGESTTKRFGKSTTFSVEESSRGAENWDSKYSIKNSTATTNPPKSPTPEFENEIEGLLQQRMVSPAYKIMGEDYQLLKEMLSDGVPKSTIEQGINLAFDRFEPRHKHHKIASLKYCAGVIYDLHQQRIDRETEQIKSRDGPAAQQEPEQSLSAKLGW